MINIYFPNHNKIIYGLNLYLFNPNVQFLIRND